MNAAGAIFVMSSFAAIWWIGGAAQSGRDSLVMYAIGIAISVLLIVLGGRGAQSAAPQERKRRGRIVGIASATEGVAILVAINVLINLGHRDLIAPAVAVIVGLHFVPLARWLPAPIYYLTGALLVADGVAGAFVQPLPTRILAVCFGAAAVLWFSCAVLLLRVHRQNQLPRENV